MTEPILSVKALDCGILAPVDLALARGETVCLSGASGTGKSRLLRAIADLDPNGGQVWLAGTERAQLPAYEWRRRVGYLPAETHWWEARVGAHMAVPERKDLQALGFGEEVLDWEVARMSSGERARLGLLRLWGQRPEVLLLDEPTASLDPAHAQAVEQWLGEIARQGRALLWVSHDPAQIDRVADRAFRIESGRLQQWK